MKLAFFIARRLKLRQQGSQRSAVSVKVSTAGVALSVIVMLLTIAIVRGFKQQITEKIVGFDSQITITSTANNFDSEQPFVLTPELEAVIRSTIAGVCGTEVAEQANVTASIVQPGMLKTEGDFAAVAFRAYEPTHDYSFVRENLTEGAVTFDSIKEGEPSSNDIVISKKVADKLNLKVGDKVNTVFFVNGKLRPRKLTVTGVYRTSFANYDEVVAYASIDLMRKIRLFDPEMATRVEINSLPMEAVAPVNEQLQQSLQQAYYTGQVDEFLRTESVLQTGVVFFNWLNLLDANVVVIIVLMSAISLFTLIASLFILILERVSLIGTLKTIGATNGLIRKVFIILASKILLRGLAIGNVVGLAIIIVQHYTHLLPLDPEAYYIDFVPVDITVFQVVLLNVCAVVAAVAAMILPSMLISKMSPAKTVRFE